MPIDRLHAIVERQAAIASKIAAAIQVSRPDAEPSKPDGYDEAAIHILEDMRPTRR